MLLTVRAKGLMGITVFLYVLLGAVFCNQLCLFPVFLPSRIFLKFWRLYVRSWKDGPPPQAVCTCAGQWETGLAQINTLPLVAEGSFSSHGTSSSGLLLLEGSCVSQGAADLSKKERGGDEELYVTWADEAPDVSLPFGTPSPPGCLTEHCNSWHCL